MKTAGEHADFRHPSFWTGRVLKLFGVLVLMLLLLRLGWGWQARRMVESGWARVAQRGEPTSFAQVPYPSVPPEENAWDYQYRAARALVAGTDSPRNSNLEYRGYPPYGPQWIQLAKASEAAHGKVFALARQARQFPKAQIGDGPPSGKIWSRGLHEARTLASTLADGAEWAQHEGDDLEAVERLRDVFHLARSVQKEWFLISHLVAIGIDALGCNSTRIIAPGLRLEAGAADAARRREAVRGLIGDLLDETAAWEGLERSFVGERLLLAEYIGLARKENWAIAPLADMEMARAHRRFDGHLVTARMRNYPDARKLFEANDPEEPHGPFNLARTRYELPRYSRWFGGIEAAYDRYFTQVYRVLAERRATAISLAAQLYRADHGKWPQKLEDLAPKYLPRVPADPFHSDGRAMGYVIKKGARPDGGDRPMVFFDNSEVENEDPRVKIEPWYDWREGLVNDRLLPGGKHVRQYRDLSRFAPPPGALEKLLPKAVENDPDESDAPGKNPKEEDGTQ